MDGITHLIRVAEAYGSAVGIESSTVSWRLFGDGKKLDALKAGADIQVRRFEAAMSWLSRNWPDGAVWPTDVSRPNVEHEQASPSDAPVMAPAAELGAGAKTGAVQ